MTPKAQKKIERFVKAYVIDRNATKAAIAAGYSKQSAHVTGCRLLKNAKVQELLSSEHQKVIVKLEEINDITIERVMRELARIAFLDPRNFFNAQGQLRPVHELDEDTARALAGMDIQELAGAAKIDGNGMEVLHAWVKKIKITNKIDALQLLGKQLGMFNDKKDGKDETPFELNIYLTEPPPRQKAVTHDLPVIDMEPVA